MVKVKYLTLNRVIENFNFDAMHSKHCRYFLLQINFMQQSHKGADKFPSGHIFNMNRAPLCQQIADGK